MQAEMVPKKKFKSGFAGNEDDEELDEDESNKQFRGVEIRSKSLEMEKNWLKGKFHEMRKISGIKEGASYRGRTIGVISKSIYLRDREASCVLKLTNHLNVALTDPNFEYWASLGNKMTGPSVVASHFSEVFSVSGPHCDFLCSFSISNSLRMVFQCLNVYSGGILFIVGFIPQNSPSLADLCCKLRSNQLSPDLCRNEDIFMSTAPAELFVTTGQFLVRGHMKKHGRRAFVEIDISEMTHRSLKRSLTTSESENLSLSLKRATEKISGSFKRSEDFHGKMSCSVEIFNLLTMTFRSEGSFYLSSKHNNFKSSQVKPFEGTTFFVSDDTSVEGMISFQIEWTDLCLFVAFKVQEEGNLFAGAFHSSPDPPASEREMEKLMSEKHWEFHEWRKSAQAKDGDQVLQIRNVRAVISMTEGYKSLLKIRVFAF